MTVKILIRLGISLIGSISIALDGIISQPAIANTSIKTIDWDVLCAKFPLNSRCLEGKPEIISGKDVLNLPQKMNIRAGIFTLEYKEGELIRTITFRIPVNAESETGLVVVE